MNKNRRYVIFYFVNVFLFFLMVSASILEAANLQAIIVADTLDLSIGDGASVDLQKMRFGIQQIAKQTKLTLKQDIIAGKSATPTKLLSKLNKLKIKSDDVIIFFFSGHGYRVSSQDNSKPWPNLAFSQVDQAIEFDFIIQKLEQLHPRLLLAITDSCNNVIPDAFAPVIIHKASEKPLAATKISENYRELFLNTSGTLLIASSQPGEYSWATSSGSLFTLAFLQQLDQEVKTAGIANWQDLLGRTANALQGTQHPVYYILLR
jgi:hypothetical protein